MYLYTKMMGGKVGYLLLYSQQAHNSVLGNESSSMHLQLGRNVWERTDG